MKKISLDQLLAESRAETYPEQYDDIRRRIEDNKLIPVRKSPLNGKKPALHLSYWIVEEKPDYREEMEELKFRMVPAIRTDYYLKHPKVYREEAKWVRLLNRYFLEQSEGVEEVSLVSLNERSFQIWGREKFLQREQGRAVLAHCGVTLDQLGVYGTTEPLAYYSCSRQVPQTVLILENKDTFYSMRRHLLGKTPLRSIFDTEISTVIYGAGKGILRSFEDFRFCVEAHVNDPRNRILYFGDLDYEGIGIYERLAALFASGDTGMSTTSAENPASEVPDGLEDIRGIRPFVQAYEKMLEKAAKWGTELLPETSPGQNRNLSGLFFQYYSESAGKRMRQILEADRYIPQEILNITDF